jgi:hypothetical protein
MVIPPPRAPDFRLQPSPLLGPLGGAWVSLTDVDSAALDSRGRAGFRIHGQVHAFRGAGVIVGVYVRRMDGTPVPGLDASYRDELRGAGAATVLTMPEDDTEFDLFIPRHALALAYSQQPLQVVPVLFDAARRTHVCNGEPLQFWAQPIRMPSR